MSIMTYLAENLIVMAGPLRITGFAAETHCKISRNEDSVQLTVGNDGKAVRSVNPNRSATIELTLLHGSLGSQFLSDYWLADVARGAGLFPLSIVEPASGDTHVATEAWVKKVADVELGAQPGAKKWTLETSNLNSVFDPTALVRAAT